MAFHDLITHVEIQTPWDSLTYAAGPNTLFFHAFDAWTLRAGSQLVRNNSSWRKGFLLMQNHLVKIFFFHPDIMAQLSCKEIAFRNKRLNYILSALKTQVRYQLVLVFDSVFDSCLGGGIVLSYFIQCSTCLCTFGSQLLRWWLFWIQESARIWIECSTHLLWKDC